MEEIPYKRGNQVRPYQDGRFEGWEQMFDPSPLAVAAVGKRIQIRNKYILSPVKSGLMIIDQRRAHERIIYEKMMLSLENHQALAQQSLFPETLKLNAGDYQVCLEMMNDLEQWGFDIRDFGNQSVVIHGVPSEIILSGKGAVETLEMMIEQFKSLKGELNMAIPERIARSAARSSAISYGQQLSDQEMQELTDQLFACKNPNYSPSGKLIVKIMDLDELDNQFKV